MPRKITAYDLLLSCPSDVSQYINVLSESVNRFNTILGRANNTIIRTRYWGEDVYSESGKQAQALINKQIVDTSDMAVAVFWTKFGSKTENYGSGTEEEIERMLLMGKQVFLYFLDKPISPSKVNNEQLDKVKAFRDKHKSDGIYFVVPNENALASRFQKDLEQFFCNVLFSSESCKVIGKKEILWVDDCPDNNIYKRRILESYGLAFTIALSTDQAWRLIKHNDYALVISDMVRKEGYDEGYVLLKKIREQGIKIPYVIHSASKKHDNSQLAYEYGILGYTSDANDLINFVLANLLKA